jgi:amino acid adenylation domain-containing protein
MLITDESMLNSSHAQSPPDLPDQFPLSFAQQRLWLLAQMEGVSEAYHIPLALSLKGDLDCTALRQALDRILARHEALRPTFFLIDGEPAQRITAAESSSFLLIEHDLRSRNDAKAELDRLTELESAASFDLEAGPLIRGRLIRFTEDEHVLLITMHHIVSDGWSMGVLANELSALYGAFHRGESDPLPELDIQYADYAVWQRQWVEGDILKQQGAYWKTALAGAPALLELPTDHPRPAHQNYSGAFAELDLDDQLTVGLRELSRRHGVTLFMTLLTAWAVLLSRLSGQQDVLIGTPAANRGRAEIENLIGFFVNTLVVRLDLSGSPSVSELLEQAKVQALAAQQNQDIPFEQVVELARPARSMAHSPLFQVMFAWQGSAQGRIELPGLEVQSLPIPHKVAKFDLLLELCESDNSITGGIEYATSLFEQGTIKRYLGYFRNLLQAMVADDAQTVDCLPMLPENERCYLLYELNDTKADFPRGKCVHELFEEQVARTPDASAVVCEGEEISYAELNRRSNQLAHYLRELGVGPDARVAVCLERSFEMVVALMAVLKAGGAYLPLDPAYPVERLRFMLEDSEPLALLTQRHLTGLFCGIGGKVPVLDLTAASAAWSSHPLTNPALQAIGLRPEHLAYVIYTSGSTGNPKGVLVHHRGVVNRLVWMQHAYGLEPGEAVLQKTPFGFDVSVWEFFWTLQTGAKLVMARPEGHKDPGYLVETIRRNKITTMHFVPSMLQIFLEHEDLSNMPSLVRVVCSGEALPAALLQRFQERIPHAALHNLYGPTEAAVDVTAWTAPANFKDSMVPIGKPVWNTQMYVLDGHGEPVPMGVTGELYIGGVQVARGYLNRPELTAERFVADPFSSEPGARMYRTGDLARWLADGNIEYLGRNDFQVKIRGFRIELGEIEARLAEHPAVREVAVIAREDTPGDKRLVAYYTASLSGEQELGAAGAEQFRSHLSASLAVYMVPAAYVCLESLPLTPNGKLDRKALPAPETASYSTRGYEPPRGEMEMKLAAIWAEVLKLDRVGRHDNFFDLGGHSLLAVQLMVRLQEIIQGDPLPLRAVLEAPTVEQFAVWLRIQDENEQRVLVRIRQGTSARPPFFCVHASDGIAVGMRPLAMAMDADLPFYCLQAKGLDGSEPFASVEEAARCYLDEIRTVQPHGPYYLGGYCFGGVVAFEMARILEQSDEPVAVLILIDSFNPAYLRFKPKGEMLLRLLRFYLRRIALHSRRIFSFRLDTWLNYAIGRLKAMYVHAQRFVKKVTDDEGNQLPVDPSTLEIEPVASAGLEEVLKRLKQVGPSIQRKFTPEPYNGDAVVFRVSERNEDPFEDYFLGWKPVIRGAIESSEIETTHEGILRDPAVRRLAERIDAKLRESSATTEENLLFTPRLVRRSQFRTLHADRDLTC